MKTYHIYHHIVFEDSDTVARLQAITAKLDLLLPKEMYMSTQLDTLSAQVQKQTEVEAGAVLLIKGLAQQIQDGKDDPAKLQALADQLNASATELSAAITANTPTAPA